MRSEMTYTFMQGFTHKVLCIKPCLYVLKPPSWILGIVATSRKSMTERSLVCHIRSCRVFDYKNKSVYHAKMVNPLASAVEKTYEIYPTHFSVNIVV